MQTETALEWTVGTTKENILGLAIWKVGADGKTLSYWGFSSHDNTVDMLTGELTDTTATVSGTTRYGPMRLTLTLAAGVLSQHLWVDKQDMGIISYTKKPK